jgi:tetratricopeptide (TPR) repeat protein
MIKKIVFQQFILSYITLLFIFQYDLFGQPLTAEQIYKKVSGAVVVIQAYNTNNELVNEGSGVVISDKGYIVTNYHVLEGCQKLEVLHNKQVVPYVDIIGIDVSKDILILKIKAKRFPSIKIGNVQKINIGDRVYAIGSPLGFENTISEGIISGLRNDETTGRNLIQITASISPGSSGGAVVNDKGELIGISSFTAAEGQNLNFAIPIDDVLAVKIGSYSKDDSYKDFELFYKGYNADKNGNYQEAISYYTSYLTKYPNDANAYLSRGNAKTDLEDYTGAIQDYSKAIEINPNFAGAYYNRGLAKYDLDDYRGAIQDYSKAIEINPNDAGAYINRGSAKHDLEDYTGAIQDYNKAIEINPNDAKAYIGRGLAKSQLGDKDGACLDWSKAGELGYSKAYDMIKEFCK